MMNLLSIAPPFFHGLVFRIQPVFHGILISYPLAGKVYELAKQHFVFLEYACVFTFGAKELAYDRVKALQTAQAPHGDNPILHEFYKRHGLLFAASGVVGMAASLGRSILLQDIALGLFNCGNVIALMHFGEVLQHSSDPVERKSAALGLVSNLGYILASAAYVMGMPAIVALLLGCLALSCGGIKIIYDAIQMLRGN